MSQQTYFVFTYMHMCKQTKNKNGGDSERIVGLFSVIDFGKKFDGMQKLLRITHKIILRSSALIKIVQTICIGVIHTSLTWSKSNLA